MKDISLLKDRKNELGYTDQEIADLSGVPLETVQKIFSDATCFPFISVRFQLYDPPFEVP